MPVTKVAFQIRDALRVRLQVRRFHASQQTSFHRKRTSILPTCRPVLPTHRIWQSSWRVHELSAPSSSLVLAAVIREDLAWKSAKCRMALLLRLKYRECPLHSPELP